ncbi:hypothetical protein CSB45_07935 [candidate division KSB3 bacterium]|uniref:Aromatic hydrocarbon degradation protein n=1 Tax=candidate division KSB3 bacterium TaxID=2044937 RepID=A0A2G6E5W1_9BACT|nr:MAG: hypothetical protein CSB45_07935 [candidate division KSB3 bacterium]PIE28361.1 MAG: hypothetical protein CSA57_14275 [candidate division KSB3 bacterium]
MKKRLMAIVVSISLSMSVVGMSFGAGFQIPEQGAASVAMGMGGIGKADDLSAAYQNPAGLIQSTGTQIFVNSGGISPRATYTRTGYDSIENKSDLILVPSLMLSSDFGKWENLVLAVGINAQFGLRNEYDDMGPQRYISNNISLVTIYVGPYAAWQIKPNISIGAGIQYVHASAEIGQKINYGGVLNPMLNENPDYDGILDITDAVDNTVAGNLGLLWKAAENLQVGLTWRSGVDLDLEGDVTLDIPAAITALSGGLMQSINTTGATTLSLPQIVGAGLAFQATDGLELIADLNWLNWSVYENIDFDFSDNTPYFPDTENPRDWEDTWTFRLGGEYMLKEHIALRAGYLFDQSPIPDKSIGPELPTNDRHGISAGVGYAWNNMTLDIAYAHLFIKDRSVSRNIRHTQPIGDYETSANIFAASLGFTF